VLRSRFVQHLLRSYERSHEKFMQLRRWIFDVSLQTPNVSNR
jgi:hypothetical protein